VAGSRLNPGIQIFLPEYVRTFGLKKIGVLGTFVCLNMFQVKNWVVAETASSEVRATSPIFNSVFSKHQQKLGHLNQNVFLSCAC
jgi:hypothetical protein